jgi:hypothetical protein
MVISSEVQTNAQPIAQFLEHLQWLATNERGIGSQTNAQQLWALYEETVRNGAAPVVVADVFGVPLPSGLI